MQAIADWGGMAMADKAVEFANNSPKISRLLKTANIDPAKIRSELQSPSNNVMQSNPVKSTLPTNDFKNRLNKLR